MVYPCILPSLRVHYFRMIQIRNCDPRSLGASKKPTNPPWSLEKDLPVPLMHCDPNVLGSLILIWNMPREGTLVSS